MELAPAGLYSGGGKRWRSQVSLLWHDIQIALIVPIAGISQNPLILFINASQPCCDRKASAFSFTSTFPAGTKKGKRCFPFRYAIITISD